MSDARHEPASEKRDGGMSISEPPGRGGADAGALWALLALPAVSNPALRTEQPLEPVARVTSPFSPYLNLIPSFIITYSHSFMKALSCHCCPKRQRGPLSPFFEHWGFEQLHGDLACWAEPGL